MNIEFDLKEILIRLETKIDKLSEEVGNLKGEVGSIRGEVKALEAKVDGIAKQIDTQEFIKKYWHIGENKWVFATRQEGKTPMRLQSHDDETQIVRHVKVKGNASPDDGNLIYWSSRMGTHPEVPKRVSLLLKTQKGKCTQCGLYFREEDLLEVDHVIPRNKGGKDEYKNLQILHQHCHDVKTTEDGSVGSTHDKRQVTEEPDEAKVSRPVLIWRAALVRESLSLMLSCPAGLVAQLC